MLQILSKNIDINLVSCILSRYKVKASISRNFVTIYGIIPDELLESLCSTVSIVSVQNFNDNSHLANSQSQKLKSPAIPKNTYFISNRDYKPLKVEATDIPQKVALSDKDNRPSENSLVYMNMFNSSTFLSSGISPSISKEYDLLYPKVLRGEVYLCDLGTPYGHEQGKLRPVIVVQNDVGNSHSPTTIVVPVTSQSKKPLPTHVEFYFSKETLVRYNPSHFNKRLNVALAEQVQVVDTRRLRKYLGRMRSSFMKEIDKTLYTSLDLSPTLTINNETPISPDVQKDTEDSSFVQLTENREVNSPYKITNSAISTTDQTSTNESITSDLESVQENESATPIQEQNSKPKTPREELMENISAIAETNPLQLLILERFSMESALDISTSKLSTEEKVKALLQTLGLNNPKKEFNYLVRGIMAYHNNPEIDFHGICIEACKTEFYADKNKVKNMMNARIKKKFSTINSPYLTFEFIKVINYFL